MSVCPVRGRGPTWAAVDTKKVLVGCDFFLAPIQPNMRARSSAPVCLWGYIGDIHVLELKKKI